jgi:hypothetical protein
LELFKAAQQRSGKPSYFQDYANKAQRNLTEAKKDNDFIYHERIPDVKMLPSVGKAMLAKSLPVPEKLSQNFKGKEVSMQYIDNLRRMYCLHFSEVKRVKPARGKHIKLLCWKQYIPPKNS